MPAARNCGGVVLHKGAGAPDLEAAAQRAMTERPITAIAGRCRLSVFAPMGSFDGVQASNTVIPRTCLKTPRKSIPGSICAASLAEVRARGRVRGNTAEAMSSPRLSTSIDGRVLPYALWPPRWHDAWHVHDAHGQYAHDAPLSRDARLYAVWRLLCDAARRAHDVLRRARDVLRLWWTWGNLPGKGVAKISANSPPVSSVAVRL